MQSSETGCATKSPAIETIDNSFRVFFFEVFSVAIRRVEGKFTPSKHLWEWSTALQAYQKTGLVSARFHLKTTVHLGYVAWRARRVLKILQRPYHEALWMAYKEDLAGYQMKRLRRYIEAIPEYFGDIKWLSDAETVVRLGYVRGKKPDGSDDMCEYICEPCGITSFKRGRHPDDMILDDVLKDPESKLSIDQILKITKIFREEILPMPKQELRVVGTPQDDEDLFSFLEKNGQFWCRRYPAFVNEAKDEVLWKEEYPADKLREYRSSMGEKAFNKEMMCRPVRSEDGFFKSNALDLVICSKLKNYSNQKPPKLNEFCFGGFDIGKKSHPSHLAIFAQSRNGVRRADGQFEHRLIQVHSKWMDGWDYTEQIEYLREAIVKFKMNNLLFDNTRGEFESFHEEGRLPSEMTPFIFSAKSKFDLATNFDARVCSKNILLLKEERQKRQLLNVDNELRAVETAEGHGDCFFSIALAIRAYIEGSGVMLRFLG